ncbi:MAG TPA: replication-associated recombination protein A [Candidatus Andersenbacteria bacterium]|nr:replication-associated recombination protein A [Candidatus Andersenbacteria bacterium]
MRTERKQEPLYKPLAALMRPKTLDDFVGHTELLGEGKPLRKAIEQGRVGSLILWGPPGVGKTTLAELIARNMDAAIERVSAVTAGVKDLRDVLSRAAEWRKIKKPTVLIVDEIHRFNKSQQDVLLPAVEEGLVIMIGATTENPYFEVVSALISRAQVVRLEILQDKDIKKIITHAIHQYPELSLDKDSYDAIAKRSGGDARRALNILERIIAGKKRGEISVKDIESAAHGSSIHYDKAGDAHYDTISAFIKSLRGSDADAALFYLFRMIAAGEDPKFIIRRMFIFASEDIGNADPHALMVVAAASQALMWVGLPEAEYNLAHAACYLAAAPKSNSVTRAMSAAKQDVDLHGNDAPPGNVVNAPIPGMKQHGRGVGYEYPHNFPGHIVQQQYRPNTVQGNLYYEPGDEGFEKEVKRRIDAARKVIYGK